eukprot:3319176-Rhodomonas_salina.2
MKGGTAKRRSEEEHRTEERRERGGPDLQCWAVLNEVRVILTVSDLVFVLLLSLRLTRLLILLIFGNGLGKGHVSAEGQRPQ